MSDQSSAVRGECPTCSKPAVLDRTENKAAPFCSSRCRLVDLGKWLDESYRIPARDTDDEESNSDVN